ncbi:hypothetical protein BsWGS_24827 [Bradybaena similaris]
MSTVYMFLLLAVPLTSDAMLPQVSRIAKRDAGCNTGWMSYQKSCYSVGQEAMSWMDAKTACQARGAYLAEVTDKSEHDWIVAQLKRLNSTSVWLGASDLLIEGVWNWQTNKQPFGPVLFWSAGQPDNRGGEFCLEMRQEYGYLWNDLLCAVKNKFICESKAKA